MSCKTLRSRFCKTNIELRNYCCDRQFATFCAAGALEQESQLVARSVRVKQNGEHSQNIPEHSELLTNISVRGEELMEGRHPPPLTTLILSPIFAATCLVINRPYNPLSAFYLKGASKWGLAMTKKKMYVFCAVVAALAIAFLRLSATKAEVNSTEVNSTEVNCSSLKRLSTRDRARA